MSNFRGHKFSPLKNPLCVALDVDELYHAEKLANDLAPVVGGFKLGPRLLLRYGSEIIKSFTALAPVFVDCKFFDIPSTMASAVEASFEAGASLVTVHALAGSDALTEVAKIESQIRRDREVRVLAVTILTSWDEGSRPSIIRQDPIAKQVEELADLAEQSGINGLVCSGQELQLVSRPHRYCVVPGIRLSLEKEHDQKRVMGPEEALRSGASVLVIGRPIIESKNPLEAATDYLTTFL